MAMGAVLMSTRVRMMAKKNSFQASMKAKTPGREEGRQRDGQDDEPEGLEGARAVHGGGPLELRRDRLEEALQDPDDDDEREREVGERRGPR